MKLTKRLAANRLTRRGAVVILVAVSLAAVLAFVAIAIDGGGLLEKRRQGQATADAAAIAAAEDLFRNYPANKGIDTYGTAEERARDIAAANGFSGNGTDSVVTVRTSPEFYTGGPNVGTALPPGYAEVSLQFNQPRYFSALFGSGAIPVPARAVARGNWEPSFIGIHVLDLHRPSSLYGNGNATVRVTGAKVIVNSDAPEAAMSNGLYFQADDFKITGGSATTGSGAFVGPIEYGTPPQPDPLRHIPEPDPTGMPVQSNNTFRSSNGTSTILPGVYRGGIKISGQGSLNMAPGIYYMDGGGFEFAGQGNLLAHGVMIYNAPQSNTDVISIGGTGSIVMSPPTSGIYTGLTLFQDRESTNEMSVQGGGLMDITGTFYCANGTLAIGGGGSGRIGSQYISRFLAIKGNGTLTIDYNPTQAIPVRILHLVE
ncbi:MAG: pilus assembly protein TadG-related protein [Planctomycetaceae bacterium]|nr:pilus assembly protein TadG-related protein [Planctomycetaceae bacterium]